MTEGNLYMRLIPIHFFTSGNNAFTKSDYHLVPTIDYRCDDKKNFSFGAPSWYHCVVEDSRIPKTPVINPLQAFVHPQTQKKKKLSCMDCRSPTPIS
jgi:hypothetical protein